MRAHTHTLQLHALLALDQTATRPHSSAVCQKCKVPLDHSVNSERVAEYIQVVEIKITIKL